MNTHPSIHALLALGYIVGVVTLVNNGSSPIDKSDAVMVPIAMLSLFVLSAAVMGYLFLARPLQLYLDGEKHAAVRFFLSTVAFFAGITLVLLSTAMILAANV